MNILVVRNDKLGDFITALPSIYVLKQHKPQAKITVLVAGLNSALAQACPFIDEVIVDTFDSALELSRALKKHQFDLSFTLFSNTKVALAQFLARIPQRVAPATKIAQIFYNRRVPQRRSQVKMSEYEYNLELIQSYFADIDLNFPSPLCEMKDKKIVFETFVARYGVEKDIVAFHPGFGGSSDANWTLEEYVELAKIILEKKVYQVVFTFGPDEEALMKKAQALLPEQNVVFYLSNEGMITFISLLSNFKLFVSTSTGTYHLAALVATPTMTFFGDSLFASVKRWKAISDETIQDPYMIPKESDQRARMFERVQTKLKDI